MRKRWISGALFAVTLALTLAPMQTVIADGEAEEVHYLDPGAFADSQVYECLLAEMDHDGDGRVDSNEMSGGSVLVMDGRQISSLKGVETVEHLQSVFASDTGISDFSVLAQCPELEMIYLEGCPVTSFDFLYHLPNAKYVNIRYTNCASIDFVKSMPNLTDLYSVGNPFTDYSPLSSCAALEFAEIDEPSITNLNLLANCQNLKNIWVCGDAITDVSAIYDKPIERVDFWGCTGIKDYSFLANYPNLKNVNLVDCAIRNFPDLRGKALESVFIPGNYFEKEEASTFLPSYILTDEWFETNWTPKEEQQLEAEDGRISFEGLLVGNVSFEATMTEEYDETFKNDFEAAFNDIDWEEENYQVYDLSLMKDVSTIAGDTTVHFQAGDTSTIEISGIDKDGEYKIYRREDDGTTSELTCYVINGKLIFDTEHFSVFAIVNTKGKVFTEMAAFSPTIIIVAAVCVLVIAAVAVVLVVVIRKKKKPAQV